MRGIIVLLCLGLIGCATAPKVQKKPPVVEKAVKKAISQEDLDRTITIFNETIKQNPSYAGAYYNRAIAYYYKKEYDKSWEDVHKAESLGLVFKPEFIESLQKASCRKK